VTPTGAVKPTAALNKDLKLEALPLMIASLAVFDHAVPITSDRNESIENALSCKSWLLTVVEKPGFWCKLCNGWGRLR